MSDDTAHRAGAASPANRSHRSLSQRLTCAWCGGDIALKARGRIPKWCSSSCRHRAWEQSRAAASGRSAVQVVDRIVERTTTPTSKPAALDLDEVLRKIKGPAWAEAIRELIHQLDTGRLYDRDLPGVTGAVDALYFALSRRLRYPKRR